MEPGYQYHVYARLQSYTSDYYSLVPPWSAVATFYSSDLP